MTPENFVYFLKGYFALTVNEGFSQRQVEELQRYIGEVKNVEVTGTLPTGISQPTNPYQDALSVDTGYGTYRYNR